MPVHLVFMVIAQISSMATSATVWQDLLEHTVNMVNEKIQLKQIYRICSNSIHIYCLNLGLYLEIIYFCKKWMLYIWQILMNAKARRVFMETARIMSIPTPVVVSQATQGLSARLVREFVFILKIVLLNKSSVWTKFHIWLSFQILMNVLVLHAYSGTVRTK